MKEMRNSERDDMKSFSNHCTCNEMNGQLFRFKQWPWIGNKDICTIGTSVTFIVTTQNSVFNFVCTVISK